MRMCVRVRVCLCACTNALVSWLYRLTLIGYGHYVSIYNRIQLAFGPADNTRLQRFQAVLLK